MMLSAPLLFRRARNQIACGLLFPVALGLWVPVSSSAAEKVDSAKQADLKLDRLIADLGSQDYRTREAATRQLIAFGPGAIEAVSKAAQTQDLEVSYRAVRILESLMDAGDGSTQDRIAQSLKTLADRETTSAAGLATDVLALYQFTLSDRAIEQLRKLGAVVTLSEEIPLMEPGFVEVILSDGWKGTSADLKLLKQVRNLQWLRAINVPLQGADVSMISELSQLMQLDLYGTGVSSADTEKLATALPNATVDRRNGALLGVKGLPNMPNCIINDVPPGTAAEAAGIRAGDEIVSFNGQPVHNFEEFTALVADKKGGEQVKVELRREEQLLAKDVTLGRWTADAASTGQFQPRAFIRPALPAVPAAPNR
jgi:hypothetical protein